jgi:hypothetical protein
LRMRSRISIASVVSGSLGQSVVAMSFPSLRYLTGRRA